VRRPRWPHYDKPDQPIIGWDKPPRPFVAFAAVDRPHAVRLYRAQNVVWVWLGVVALLSMISYFARPHLGPVIVTPNHGFDITRNIAFGVGGVGITCGIWVVRRVVEVWGHIFFATGAILTAIGEVTLHLDAVSIITTAGVAVASALRVWYIVAWIGAGRITAVVETHHVDRGEQ